MLCINILYKNKLSRLLFCLSFVSFTTFVFANKPHVINIPHESYHADNKNWCIGQDERGVMYFANDLGLLEFDGIEWKLNKLPNSLNVRSLAVQSHNTIYTGSYEEFGRWDRDVSGRLVYTSLSDKLENKSFKNDDFWKIWIDGDKVYFQSFPSIYVYKAGSTISRIADDKAYLFLLKVRDKFLAQQIRGPIFMLKDGKFEKIEGCDVFAQTDVRVILPYGHDQYLIGTSTKGIYIYDGHSLKDWNPALSSVLKSKELNCALLTSSGNYLLGTILDGIYVTDMDGNITGHISSANTLQNNTVLSIFEDNLKNVWVGLDKGISYIQYIDNISCYIDTGSKVGTVYDAAVWNNKLFIGTNQGVFYMPTAHIQDLGDISGMQLINGTQGQVWALRVIDGKLYCCHNKGLIEIHTDLTVADTFDLGTGVYDISEMNIKNSKMLFLSTYDALQIIDKKKGKLNIPGQISEPIAKTMVDHLGNMWLQHPNRGVYRYHPDDNLTSLRSIACYGGNNNDNLPYKLKIFKVGGRIALLGNDTFYTYDDIYDRIITDNVLNNCFKGISNIKQIVYIKDHVFWAITNTSLYLFSYDGYEASILESYNLGQALSLVSNYENISVLNDSMNLICLDNGFLMYHDTDGKTAPYDRAMPRPYIEFMQTKDNNGQISYADLTQGSPQIAYKFNTVEIGFLCNDAFALNYLFTYKLENVDADWSVAQNINSVAYERLPKGNYKFMVQSVNHLGHKSDISYITFTILPPWYQAWWAYIIYIIATVTLLYVIWILILRRYRNMHLQKIRARETRRLRALNGKLQQEIEVKNAELVTQTSFIIQKNELILKIHQIIDDFYNKNTNKAIAPLHQKINVMLNSVDTEEDWKTFLIKFEQKHTDFFKKLKNLYPQLTSNDLRLCACIKLNLDIKETASLMNLSTRAIENNRYRLRKKLNLQSSDNLYDFFINID